MRRNTSQNNMDKVLVVVDADLEDIIPAFLENKKREAESMAQSLKEKDFQSIQVTGHRMKGEGAGYGFERISQIGAAIEISAQKRMAQEILQLLHDLQRYLNAVDIVYQEE